MRTILTGIVLLLVGLTSAGCTTSRETWNPFASRTPESSKPADKSDEVAKAKTESGSAETPVAQASSDTKTEKPAAEQNTTEQTAVSTAAQEASKPAGESESATPSPFQPSRPADAVVTAAAVSEENTASTSATTATPSTAPAPAAAAKPVGPLNKDLLVLIDRELQDATPAERATWFDQLKHVDPAVVPDILRARRMSLQIARPEDAHGTVLLAQSGQPAATGAPQPQGTASAPHRDPASSPLGWGNPWGQPATSAAGNDPFGVVPAQHSATGSQRQLLTAHYQVPTDHPPTAGNVEHAVMRQPLASGEPQILLQNYETPAVPHAGHVPAMMQPPGQTSAAVHPNMTDPRTNSANAVPWPSHRPETPPAQNGFSSVTSHLPFSTNLVQNVVGLVPGRSTQTANAPAAVIPVTAQQLSAEANSFPSQLEQTIAFLEQEVATLQPGSNPESQAIYIRKHVALRLLYLMGQQQERALTAIPGIPPAEQEFWQQLIWGMVNSLDHEQIPNPKDRASQTITQLNSAIRRLQEVAELQIRHVAFCHQILYFGNYEKLPRNEFSPGQEVLLYAEIDHFKSDPTADGQYRTLLRSTLEILSPNGELRKQFDFPATEDLCSTYRRDYFHNYQFRIPERMPLGPHILKLTVFDELGGKLASYSLHFVVK